MLALLAGLTEPAAWTSNEWIAVVLLVLVAFVVGLGVFCRFMVLRLLRLERPAGSLGWRDAGQSLTEGRKFKPSMFEIPSRWVAIKSTNLQIVQSALCMHNPAPCSWEDGLARAHRQKLFIAPPIGGWISVEMKETTPDQPAADPVRESLVLTRATYLADSSLVRSPKK